MNNRKLREITIELTSRCNFKCRHCYISDFTNKGISLNDIEKVLDDARKLGTYTIVYTGGEVLLRKDFIDIISITRKKGFSVNVLSNGYLLNDSIAKKLSELYISSFGITLFSLDNKINDFITRAKNSSTKVMEAINLLKKYGIRVEVKIPVMIYNYSTFNEVKRYCYKNNIKFVTTSQITGLNNGSFENKSLRLKPNLGFKVMKESLPEIYSIKTNFKEDDYPCKVIQDSIFIDSKGEVFPCSTFYYSIGNINSDGGLIDIWNSGKVLELQNLKNKDLICSDCNIREYCDRCIGLAFMDGDFRGCSKFDLEFALEKLKYLQKEEEVNL
ncbi:radical SAM/SPASM domain-containing protein [uncultured Parvimonas sp.]|uniref:radical SAM/SPASM domain-containing protein n=1 Tax=uncultured Parvimonas sp. TaxID=747372 RepID=UPI002804EF82|nr:radical SAM protein [uncultured Parvimonas sp.]